MFLSSLLTVPALVTSVSATPAGPATFGTRLLVDDVDVLYNVTAVQEASLDPDPIKIHPNPASSAVTVDLPSGDAAAQYNLFNSAGQQVSLPRLNNILDTSGLASGGYMLQVTTDRTIQHLPLIIAR